MIQEAYVSLKTAKLLKEKRFPTIKFGWSIFNGKVMDKTPHTFIEDNGRGGWYDSFNNWLSCPTQAQVMKWLREVHNLFISINFSSLLYGDAPFYWNIDEMIYDWRPNREIASSTATKDYTYKSYEDAVEAAIQYCLTNLI